MRDVHQWPLQEHTPSEALYFTLSFTLHSLMHPSLYIALVAASATLFAPLCVATPLPRLEIGQLDLNPAQFPECAGICVPKDPASCPTVDATTCLCTDSYAQYAVDCFNCRVSHGAQISDLENQLTLFVSNCWYEGHPMAGATITAVPAFSTSTPSITERISEVYATNAFTLDVISSRFSEVLLPSSTISSSPTPSPTQTSTTATIPSSTTTSETEVPSVNVANAEIPSPLPSKGPSIGILVSGGVAGGLALVLIAGVAFCWLRRKKRSPAIQVDLDGHGTGVIRHRTMTAGINSPTSGHLSSLGQRETATHWPPVPSLATNSASNGSPGDIYPSRRGYTAPSNNTTPNVSADVWTTRSATSSSTLLEKKALLGEQGHTPSSSLDGLSDRDVDRVAARLAGLLQNANPRSMKGGDEDDAPPQYAG